MQLRFLHVSGPNADPATVDFAPGLNVINGPSNTGKSYILALINYMLGAQDAPEAIADQSLYDLAHLGVVLDDGREKTLVRALQGGDIRIIDGLTKARPEPKQGIAVSGRHGSKASLSAILLEQLSASGARLTEERSELAQNARELLPRIESLQTDILREVPSVQTVRSQTSNVIERKLTVQRSLEFVRRRDRLVSQRSELGVVPDYDSSTMVAEQSLNGVILDAFCRVVEAELQSWDFPDAQGFPSNFREWISQSQENLGVPTARAFGHCCMERSASA